MQRCNAEKRCCRTGRVAIESPLPWGCVMDVSLKPVEASGRGTHRLRARPDASSLISHMTPHIPPLPCLLFALIGGIVCWKQPRLATRASRPPGHHSAPPRSKVRQMPLPWPRLDRQALVSKTSCPAPPCPASVDGSPPSSPRLTCLAACAAPLRASACCLPVAQMEKDLGVANGTARKTPREPPIPYIDVPDSK